VKIRKDGGHGQDPNHPWFRANGIQLAKNTVIQRRKGTGQVLRTIDAIIRGEKGPMGARWALHNKPPLRFQ